MVTPPFLQPGFACRGSTSFAAVLLAMAASSSTHRLGDGDTQIKGQVNFPSGEIPEEHRNALFAVINEIDPQAGTQIGDAIDAENLKIGYLSGPKDNIAYHDKGTILINGSWWNTGVLAVAILHEWQHIQRIPSSAPPDERDSDDSDPCDVCAHSLNHASTGDQLVCAAQNGDISQEELCDAIGRNAETGKKMWAKCRHSGCQDYDGTSYSSHTTKPRPDCPPPPPDDD